VWDGAGKRWRGTAIAGLALSILPASAITELLFSDNFTTANSSDPNLNLGSRQGGSLATRYAFNLPNLITQLRANFNAPNAPFVLGTIGFGGAPLSTKSAAFQAVYNAQIGVNNPAGKVRTVDTFPYWRSTAESPGNQDFHYNNNAETYTLVGDALARAMIELQVDESPPSPSPMTFASAPTGAASGSVSMVATTASDPSGPVAYWFENSSNGNNSGWITSTLWSHRQRHQRCGIRLRLHRCRPG